MFIRRRSVLEDGGEVGLGVGVAVARFYCLGVLLYGVQVLALSEQAGASTVVELHQGSRGLVSKQKSTFIKI